jgi:hypothetical protein
MTFPAKSSFRAAAFAYLAGFVSHCALDRAAHPYVYSMTGFDHNGNLTSPYNEYHRRFEADMDTLLCKQFTGGTPYDFNIPEKLRLSKTEQMLLAGQAGYMMRLFYAAARDKNGCKKSLCTAIEKIIDFFLQSNFCFRFTKVKRSPDYVFRKNGEKQTSRSQPLAAYAMKNAARFYHKPEPKILNYERSLPAGCKILLKRRRKHEIRKQPQTQKNGRADQGQGKHPKRNKIADGPKSL